MAMGELEEVKQEQVDIALSIILSITMPVILFLGFVNPGNQLFIVLVLFLFLVFCPGSMYVNASNIKKYPKYKYILLLFSMINALFLIFISFLLISPYKLFFGL